MNRKLAIKGHGSRGNEIVEILKMLGAQNPDLINGCCTYLAYYIDDGNIETLSSYNDDEFIVFSLQDFLYLYPYKINDLLYMKNNNSSCFITGMRWNEKIECVEYHAEFGADNDYGWHNVYSFQTPNEMETPMKNTLAELLNHIKNTPKEELEREFNELEEWSHVGPTVEEFMDFCNKVNKKPIYPKTILDVLYFWNPDRKFDDDYQTIYKKPLFEQFQLLIYCRDAYWKIAGDWKPDWNNISDKHCIFVLGGEISLKECQTRQCILAFPTAEIRNIFYESFKVLIENCKELL